MALCSEACVPASAAGGELPGSEVSFSFPSTVSHFFFWFLLFSIQGVIALTPHSHSSRYLRHFQAVTVSFQGSRGRLRCASYTEILNDSSQCNALGEQCSILHCFRNPLGAHSQLWSVTALTCRHSNHDLKPITSKLLLMFRYFFFYSYSL